MYRPPHTHIHTIYFTVHSKMRVDVFFSCKFVYSNNVKTNLHKSEIGKEDFTQDIVIVSTLLEEER